MNDSDSLFRFRFLAILDFDSFKRPKLDDGWMGDGWMIDGWVMDG